MSTQLSAGEQLLDAALRSGLLTSLHLQPYARTAANEGAEAVANRLIADRLLTQFQAKQLLAGKVRGFFLAEKFKALALIGSGQLGAVLLCENLPDRKLAAVKMLKAEDGSGRLAALERLVREGLAAVRECPNVVRVQDLVRTSPSPLLVMDYVDGRNLQQLVAQTGPLSVQRAVHYVKQAAVVLQNIHGKRVVHKGVKPGNLILDRAGVIHVAEVGLVTIFQDLAREANPAVRDDPAAGGTADYLSPEQAGRTGVVDHRSDLYSLGATLYFLLTGQGPFETEPLARKLIGHQFRQPVPVRDIRPEVPVRLAEILSKMMAKNPADRYQSPADLVLDLGPWGQSAPAPSATELPRLLPVGYRLGLVSGPGGSEAGTGSVTDIRWSGEMNRAPAEAPVNEKSRIARRLEAEPEPDPEAEPEFEVAEEPEPEMPPAPRSRIINKAALGDNGPPTASRARLSPKSVVGGKTAAAPAAPAKASQGTRLLLLVLISLVVAVVIAGLWWIATPGSPALPTSPSKPPVVQKPEPDPVGKKDTKVEPKADPKANPGGTGGDPKVDPKVAPVSDIVITGSGSTFIKPAMDYWTRLYEEKYGIKITYSGIGSTRGVENMVDRVLDFGCTDAFMSNKQLEKARDKHGDIVHIPLALGAVVVTYNLPTVKEQVRLTGAVLAHIYLGKIKKWNDDAITASNPGITLPDLPITVIRRSDGSGTTAIWTDFLNKASPLDWGPDKVGTSITWPTGEDAEKNDGVAKAVSRKEGAVGYVELSFALERNLRFAQVKNRAEKFVQPSLENVTAAANAALQNVPPDLRFTLTDPPGEDSYPIVGMSWAIIYANQPGPKGKELVKFLRWAIHDGQSNLKALRYSPLPAKLVAKIDEKLSSIQ
ncbi:phosphate ABC transporter substrate-binding protein PstS [Frigoriglobus tundricola]|nr:phosphate ABC transporter substrate-binding protein PstS [Frigoriglobus tundricola]